MTMAMYGTVAASKVRPPSPDRSALHRPRLLKEVDSALGRDARLVIIRAGMGYGKTTLAAQWAARRKSRNLQVAWVTIDPSDDLPGRFWSLVVAALERAAPALRDGRLRQEHPPESFGDNTSIDLILSEVAAVEVPIVLVFDDCHWLRSRGVLQDLNYFLLRSPRNLTFMMLGRSMPHLSAVYQLTLDDALAEVDGASLAFTRRETARLAAGTRLDVDRLLDLTEGWPAAATLATRSGSALQRTGLLEAVGDSLSCQLLKPLFDSYQPSLQKLLLQVSLLDTWSGEDLNRALGHPNGHQLIDYLRSETGLVVDIRSPSGKGPRYRFHKLLHRFLCTHAAAHPSRALTAAHARLAAWLPDEDRHAEALAHAAQAGSLAVLRSTLAVSGLQLLWQGETAQLRDLALSFGAQPLDELTVLLGAIAVKEGDTSAAADYLGRLQRSGAGDRLPSTFVILATALQGQVLMSKGRFREAVELLEFAAEQPPLDDLDLYLANVLGAALVGIGRLSEALALGTQAARRARDRGNLPALVDARSLAAAVHAAREEFGMARMESTWAIRRCDDTHLRYGPSLRPAHLVAAWCAYHALDDSSARVHNAYVRRADSAAPVIAHSNAKLSLILDFLAGHQRHEAAAGLLDRVRYDLIHGAFPQDMAICSLQTASMMLQLRHGDALESLKAELRQRQGVSGELHTISTWELMAAGNLASAQKLLSTVTSGYVESQSRSTVLTAWALTCRVALTEDRPYQARSALGEVLRLGADSGALRAFAFAGPEVRAAVVREQPYFPTFRHSIARIARFRAATSSAFRPPLTHRELDLLTLLPTFATVDEIAERLMISTNTVKTHVRGIYRKLGATSRREAIAIAQDLGLLPGPGAIPTAAVGLDVTGPTPVRDYGN